MNRNFLVFQVFFLLSGAILAQPSTDSQPLTSSGPSSGDGILHDARLNYSDCKPVAGEVIRLSRGEYYEQLQGFWLGAYIGNWTGLVTEMDKVGNIGEFRTGRFYTREDWGTPDLPSIWGQGLTSDLSTTIDFVVKGEDGVWGADDDTDMEYLYQHLLYTNQTSMLTPAQIVAGWKMHIPAMEENHLWVSNQMAFDLMQKGLLPPETGSPKVNPHFEMIDAQLTTEIFGLFSPGRPDVALEMAHLPLLTVARGNAASIARFYVAMHALVPLADKQLPIADRLTWMAGQASGCLPEGSYALAMFNFVKSKYQSGISWEQARDSVYDRYQLQQRDGYDLTSRDLYCNGCFAAGINFAASLISLYYGKGDLVATIKIGTLAGWDSDNPTATWAGLIGFMIGREGVEKAFGRKFSNKFNIGRTRINFPESTDSFENMALRGVHVVDRVVLEQLGGCVDQENDTWIIPSQMIDNYFLRFQDE